MARGNVGAHVAAVALVDLAVVVADAAGMDLHDQAVVDAHARHLGEHLGAEELLLLRVGAAGRAPVEERRGFLRGKIGGAGGGMAVIGGRAAELLEARAGLSRARSDIRSSVAVSSPVISPSLAMFRKAGELRIDDRIGTEGGNDARLPSRIADGLVIGSANRAANR